MTKNINNKLKNTEENLIYELFIPGSFYKNFKHQGWFDSLDKNIMETGEIFRLSIYGTLLYTFLK